MDELQNQSGLLLVRVRRFLLGITAGQIETPGDRQDLFGTTEIAHLAPKVYKASTPEAFISDLLCVLANDSQVTFLTFLRKLPRKIKVGLEWQGDLDGLIEEIEALSAEEWDAAFQAAALMLTDPARFSLMDTSSPLSPLLPNNYVQRKEFYAIEKALLKGNGRYYGISGLSGSGKSILAAALAHSTKLQEAYDGQIYWVGMSEKSRDRFADDSPVPFQEQLYVQLCGQVEPFGHANWQKGLAELRRVAEIKFAAKKCLIIVDNPPDEDLLEALEIHDNARFLITTQDPSILYATGMEKDNLFKIRGFSGDESRELLSKWTEISLEDLPDTATQIAQKLDRLPLALAMVGAIIKGSLDPHAAWSDILEALKEGDLADVSHKVDKYPFGKLETVFQIAIESLKEDQTRDSLFALAVFPQGWRFDFDSFAKIWSVQKESKIRKLIQSLVHRSFLQPIGTGYYALHNLIRLHIRKKSDSFLEDLQHIGPLMFPQVPLHALATAWRDELALDLLVADDMETGDIKIDEELPGGFTALHIAAERGYPEVAAKLLDNGAFVDKRAQNGFTPLIQAVFYGHPDVVSILLEYGAAIDAQADDGFTALHVAAQKNNLEIASILLQKGAAPNLPNSGRKSPLLVAAVNGSAGVADALLAILPLSDHETDPDESALRLSAAHGHVGVVKILLNAGAEVEWSSPKFHSTALHLAVQNGHPDVVRLLIAANASVENPGEDGWRPLHVAAQEGHGEIVGLLLEAGANVNVRSDLGHTPLHSAAQERRPDVVRLLLEHSADVDAQNDALAAPLHLAAMNLDRQIAGLLLDAGAAIDLQMKDGYSALHLALINRYSLVLTSSIMKSSFSFTESGTSASSAAAIGFEDGLPLIKLLLDNGASTELTDSTGDYPLHIAAQNGDLESVKLLLAAGAQPQVVNDSGQTPLDLAAQQSSNPLIKLFNRQDHPAVIELLQQL